MRNLVLSIFLITSSVFAESCKKYETEIDSYLLCYEEGKPRTCKCLPYDQIHID